jgi:TRAP-type C4-dicarboxylate transport system substrate-binding protein
MSVRAPLLILMCSVVLTAPDVSAAGFVVKLGTLAPRDSSFHKILTTMGTTWSHVPGGATLRVYPGGTAGGEADMVMKMKIGQIDAALLTANGLADIDRAVQSLQAMPMMFRSLDEVDYVSEKLRPKLDKRLRDKGFVILFWTDAGWVRFFSKTAVRSPEELKRTKLFTWAGDTETFDIYKSLGFHPVSLETNDILPMLRTGMITAVPAPPYMALTTQMYTAAPNMIALDWAPLVGALVVTERAWNKLTPAAQTEMAKAAAVAGVQMKTQNRRESNEAVEAMQKRGLQVYRPTPEIEQQWRKAAEQSYAQIRGGLVPADFFDEVKGLLTEYRASKSPVAPR